jgi:DNA-binding MurR/RpiR family transcriptional regulator
VDELNRFRQRIENHYAQLTKSEREIATYFLSNHDDAVFLPAAELAKRLDVSEATVVRFAKSVGYDSFPELRRDLQHIFRARVTPATRLQRKLADLKTGQGHILTQVIEMELQYLGEALHTVNLADFDRSVKIISHADRIFVRGGGPSAILANLFQLRMRRFGILTISITETGRDLVEKMQLLRPKDVVLATGFHRVSTELVALIEYAHKINCRIILLTDTLAAPFRDKVDVVLSARRGPVSTFHSLTVPMVILNALILAVAMAKSDASLDALNRFEELRATYGLNGNGKLSS